MDELKSEILWALFYLILLMATVLSLCYFLLRNLKKESGELTRPRSMSQTQYNDATY